MTSQVISYQVKQNNIRHVDPQVAVVMVPFPAQSHLNQLLHLAHLLATSYNQIQVHYAGPANLNRRAKQRYYANIDVLNSNNNNHIHFHDFLLLPNGGTPSMLGSVLPTVSNLREPVSRLLHELSTKVRRVAVVHDSLLPFVVEEAVKSIHNVETYTFHVISAFAFFFQNYSKRPAHYFDQRELMIDLGYDDNDDISSVIPPNEECFIPDLADFIDKQVKLSHEIESGSLYNTSSVIEGRYVELLEKLTSNANSHDTKVFAIGPLNPMDVSTVKSQDGRHKCLEWLDRQEKDSVMYISFGTTTSISNDQIRELALGLIRSKQRFLWVLTSADYKGRQALRDQLPDVLDQYEYDEGRNINSYSQGMVVRDWAPQLEILAHPSTGGFISHCGWGSCVESISMGVPIVAWPMQFDQPKNAILLTRVLKIGLLVREWENRAELVMSSMVVDVVRKLLATDQGMEMRKRAKALRDAVRGSLSQGGASPMEMDSFVAHISRDENNERQALAIGKMKPSNMIQATTGTMSRM